MAWTHTSKPERWGTASCLRGNGLSPNKPTWWHHRRSHSTFWKPGTEQTALSNEKLFSLFTKDEFRTEFSIGPFVKHVRSHLWRGGGVAYCDMNSQLIKQFCFYMSLQIFLNLLNIHYCRQYIFTNQIWNLFTVINCIIMDLLFVTENWYGHGKCYIAWRRGAEGV